MLFANGFQDTHNLFGRNPARREGHMLRGKGNGEVVAVGFSAGFVGAGAVLLTARLLFYVGIGPALGVVSPLSLVPPDVYRPLVWGGLWGIPLGFILRGLRGRHKTVGFIYFLAPVAALYLIFMPMSGMGVSGSMLGRASRSMPSS